jgi:MoaA/NifB/PqqE/SkfB family radical SAM enzyme/polysaccharide pyruvyl transferase WcaK-like protein
MFSDRPLPLEKPKVIQFPVIDICNSRCQMCRIWENKQSTDITPEQLKKGLASGLFSEVEGIGFNGGEPTLREDLLELVEIVIQSLPNLKYISMITNAFKYRQVIEQVEGMAKLGKQHNLHFDLMVSLDGFEEVHDIVRGKGGNFKNAQHVIDYALQSDYVDNVRIGCTVIRENVLKLAPLLQFCIKRGVYIKYRLGVPHQRLYTENLVDPYALTFEEKYEFVVFLEGLIRHYEKSPLQNIFYRSLIDQIVYDKPRAAGCDWQHRGATITAKGELAYCAVQSNTLMADISVGDPTEAYFGNESHLKDIIKNKCDSCNHDYVGLPNKQYYRQQFIERFRKPLKIKQRLQHIPGFSKLEILRQNHWYNGLLNKYRLVSERPKLALKKERQKVLICGWYGTETLGDKGIIGGIMYQFRELLGSETQFIMVSLNRHVTKMTQLQMPEFIKTSVVTVEQGIMLAASMDHVVFGGGPLMAIPELAPMQVIFERAKASRIPTLIAGCGVGPLGEDFYNNSIKAILELADNRIYRDNRSKDYATKLGVDTESDIVAEDPAFTWLASILTTEKDKLPEPTQSPEKQVLLLGLRDFPYLDYARHLSVPEALLIKDNYEKSVVEALKILVSNKPNIVIKPLPMCTNNFGTDDRWFYRQLFNSHNELQPFIDESLLIAEQAPVFYCNAFLEADAILAMRFHSLVFGIGLGLNSVALDYTLGKGKVRSLAERYDVNLLSMIDLNAQDLASKLQESLIQDKPSRKSLGDLQFGAAMARKLKAYVE